jgi:hypothetical protein
MDQTVYAKWWRIPVGEVPRSLDREAQVLWLYDWWERIDAWISRKHLDATMAPSPPPAAGSSPAGTAAAPSTPAP